LFSHIVIVALNPDQLYNALVSRDARFDGTFFVGVTSTGIYCRNVCRVKQPQRKNCTFHRSAAAAESAGFRPCLRCRPELAPGFSSMEAITRLAQLVLRRIEEGALRDGSVADLADEFGVSERHLRRAVQSEFGVAPNALAQTYRLHLSKQLLTDTQLPITDVAYASGFASLRRFNASFKEAYKMEPRSLRKARTQAGDADTIEFEISYRPPYAWDKMLDFLRLRALTGVEQVRDNTYARTVSLEGHSGIVWISNDATRSRLNIKLSPSLLPVISPLMARLKKLFDAHAEPLKISQDLGALAAAAPGLRLPGAFDTFEIAVRAILGQQVSVKAATTIAGRYVNRFGERMPQAGPLHVLTPTAERIAQATVQELKEIGIVTSRAEAIHALALAISRGELVLRPALSVESTIEQLTSTRGIGEWTAQYIAMRCLGWPDIFLKQDVAIQRALGTKDMSVLEGMAEQWRPWRSYAVMHVWSQEVIRPGVDTMSSLRPGSQEVTRPGADTMSSARAGSHDVAKPPAVRVSRTLTKRKQRKN
jgi:AraC family transcriptional regulator, regulatory protein of adaptative response / DNA-3-methyladenine glycosylase II